jgi:hypothetical protein
MGDTKHALYTEATGDGPWHVQVEILVPGSLHVGRTLALLKGCSWRHNPGGDFPSMRISVPRRGVTDFEHDPASMAEATLLLPHVTNDGDDYRRVVGVLDDLRLYPDGTDPLATTDGDTRKNWCDDCPTPHPMAPYQPPERDETSALLGWLAVVTMWLPQPEEED